MTKSSGSEIPNSLAALFCLSERGEKNCQFVLILPGRNSVHLRLFRMQGKQKTATATGCADVNVAEKQWSRPGTYRGQNLADAGTELTGLRT